MSTAVEQSTSASWQPAIVRIQNKFQTNVIHAIPRYASHMIGIHVE